jgi:hypothetical protein
VTVVVRGVMGGGAVLEGVAVVVKPAGGSVVVLVGTVGGADVTAVVVVERPAELRGPDSWPVWAVVGGEVVEEVGELVEEVVVGAVVVVVGAGVVGTVVVVGAVVVVVEVSTTLTGTGRLMLTEIGCR